MKTRFFAFAALALTLAACNNDNENLNDGPVAAKFIADITPATRVNSEGTDWTDGDRIGVTGAGFTNVPYKRENGKFVTDGTTIYFNDTETHTFHAYYPYQSDGGTVTVSTAADKQGPGIDFLFASGATGDTHNPDGELHRRPCVPPLHESHQVHLQGRRWSQFQRNGTCRLHVGGAEA